MQTPHSAQGQLFYLLGASGAGKDSLIDYARQHVAPTDKILFAHRYITRDAHAGGENHIALSADEFHLRRAHGLFAMSWVSHGLAYGVGIEVTHWLDKGFHVIVNGSR